MTARSPLAYLALWLLERVCEQLYVSRELGPRGRICTRQGGQRVANSACGTWYVPEESPVAVRRPCPMPVLLLHLQGGSQSVPQR